MRLEEEDAIDGDDICSVEEDDVCLIKEDYGHNCGLWRTKEGEAKGVLPVIDINGSGQPKGSCVE